MSSARVFCASGGALLFGAALVACDRPDASARVAVPTATASVPASASASPSASASASAAPSASAPVPEGPTGTIEGTVLLDGPVRTAQPLEIPRAWQSHPGCRDAAARYAYPFDITTPGPFPGVLVAAEARSQAPVPPRNPRLSIRDCDVVPRYIFMTPRDTVSLHLDTQRRHLPHIGRSGQVIDQLMIPGQADQERQFAQPGNYPMNVRDLPEWVGAMIYVLPNHFIDTTDLRGHFRIEHVPVGNVTVNAWYPGAVASRTVAAVRAGETAQVELRLRQAPPPAENSARPYDSTQVPQ